MGSSRRGMTELGIVSDHQIHEQTSNIWRSVCHPPCRSLITWLSRSNNGFTLSVQIAVCRRELLAIMTLVYVPVNFPFSLIKPCLDDSNERKLLIPVERSKINSIIYSNTYWSHCCRRSAGERSTRPWRVLNKLDNSESPKHSTQRFHGCIRARWFD